MDCKGDANDAAVNVFTDFAPSVSQMLSIGLKQSTHREEGKEWAKLTSAVNKERQELDS